MKLFTPENSRLAALLHGDPNDVHLGTRFGKIIVPGIMQLQGFVAMRGWNIDDEFEVNLLNPLVVPTNADFRISMESSCYEISNNSTKYATARIRGKKFQKYNDPSNTYKYKLTDEAIDPEKIDWKNYDSIPFKKTDYIIPLTDKRLLDRISSIGVSSNVLVRYLSKNHEYHPNIFFPQARENIAGEIKDQYAVMIEKLVLHVGKNGNLDEKIEKIELGLSETSEIDDKTFVASISETNGLYNLDFYLKKIPRRIFERILKN